MKQSQLDAIARVIVKENDRTQLSVIARICAQRIAEIVPEAQQTSSRRTRKGRVGRAIPNEKGLTIGDTVVFNENTSPKYLMGKTARVVGTNVKSVNLKTPDDLSYGRFRNSRAMRCPNSIVEKVQIHVAQ